MVEEVPTRRFELPRGRKLASGLPPTDAVAVAGAGAGAAQVAAFPQSTYRHRRPKPRPSQTRFCRFSVRTVRDGLCVGDCPKIVITVRVVSVIVTVTYPV